MKTHVLVDRGWRPAAFLLTVAKWRIAAVDTLLDGMPSVD
jgi:hypothetical protein